uniref:Uncharacterized protein n=1 Tax=Avena sativa TaxID=4498 RepID=A0ACD5VNR4_AVESA
MAIMAAGRYCCSYYSPSVLPLQPQRGPPLQLDLQHAGKGWSTRSRTSLRVAASAAGGARAEPMEAATDAEFVQPADSRPIMLFDGACLLPLPHFHLSYPTAATLPNSSVCLCCASIRYIPLQSESGRKLLRRSYIKSEAVLRIMEYLNLPFPQLAAFLNIAPLFLRDFAYDNVANNRYLVFGRSESEACKIL